MMSSRRRGAEGDGASSPEETANAAGYAPEEKSKRPKDTPFRQQRVKSWLPILQPRLVVGIFFAIGVVFIPLGKWFQDESDTVVEYTVRYDGGDPGVQGCEISASNEGALCSFEIEIDEYMEPPIFVYYELDNYYQNHRRYVKSRSSLQLLGEAVDPDEFCEPLKQDTIDGRVLDLNPCGLIANSMFNDIITLDESFNVNLDESSNITMSEEGISWKSDREKRFKQPPGFVSIEVDPDGTCPSLASTCEECLSGDDAPYEGCGNYTDEATRTDYKFWYPKNDEVQYLYETYPDIVSPIEGVLNEHFIVWMRTAGLPRFRKLYGKIQEPLEPSMVLRFNVTANFYVGDFSGEKSIIVSNLSLMGARNPYLGIAYMALGSLSLAIGLAFAIKHYSDPRKLGDTKFLVWKDTTL